MTYLSTESRARFAGPVHHWPFAIHCLWLLTAIGLLTGCRAIPEAAKTKPKPLEQAKPQTLLLKHITADQGKAFLARIGMDQACSFPQPNTLAVTGSDQQIQRAKAVLDLVDSNEPYCIETLAPASMARVLPSNGQIAQALGRISIGTFAAPPPSAERVRAIIDINKDAVAAIVPQARRQDLHKVIELGVEAYLRQNRLPQTGSTRGPQGQPTEPKTTGQPPQVTTQGPSVTPTKAEGSVRRKPQGTAFAPKPPPAVKPVSRPGPMPVQGQTLPSETSRVVIRPKVPASGQRPVAGLPAATQAAQAGGDPCRPVAIPNGNDLLEMSLPDQMDLIHLLDMAGEYLGLDYVYDPEKIKNQVISLKLHGKLQGKVRVKDLYGLMETILKFKGLAMTRRQGNVVTIVPIAEALDVDPELVDPNTTAIQAGNVVVTRVFELQYVDPAGVMDLLDKMKLSVTASVIDQTLFVTCYAHRMGRIEQLVGMIDRPGRPREFRARPLKYTRARTLAEKVRTLAEQLRSVPVVVSASEGKPSSNAPAKPRESSPSRGTRTGAASGVPFGPDQAVYLDTDERTNRLLMIGYPEPLTTVEELVDALDVAQQDLRTLVVYEVRNLTAAEALLKLEQLEIVGKGTSRPRASARITEPSQAKAGGAVEDVPVDEPVVVVLEATNSLLVNATAEQHQQIESVLGYVDVVRPDQRTLRVYPIQYVEAADVVVKLAELEVIGKATTRLGTKGAPKDAPAFAKITPPAEPTLPAPAKLITGTPATTATGPAEEPQVVVLAVTNSLLVNATPEQHARIQAIIDLVDVTTPQQAIPFEIYFLESQSPAHLAEVLNKIIQETVLNKEGKVEKVIPRSEDQIVIVPDELTFSLIVYANKKNQEWISSLIKRLDRRRPQVLIDVTLVEIRKTDEFTYDLTLASRYPQSVPAPAGTISGPATEPSVGMQSVSGAFSGFYVDTHISAVLSAMQRKNYGRVLAKPKVLVNDNEKGTIKTTETTYVIKKSSIPVTSGSAGQQNTLIETAVDYQGYDAGVTLDITPHIGEGNLLRLDITTNRSDFGTVSGDKPPDRTSSDLTTIVTVPDQSTIILGGMLKLNQSRGGKKVPILGDLPLVGLLFRGVSNTDVQSKLYIFVRAQIIRPADVQTAAMEDLQRISDRDREAFEQAEAEFQQHQDVPAVRPKPTDPTKVLQTQ